MSEYGILLVDDEAEVRNAILKKIDWEGLGFSQIHAAENGQDALEVIEQYRPDVLLTDIRMPYMDGLQLCEQVRRRYPFMKLLIFSGFDDFEYAKQAIKLNVTEYILKPVNLEELSEILRRVKAGLDEEIRQRRDVDSLRAAFETNIPVLQEAFFNQFMQGSFSEAAVDLSMKQYRIDLKNARKWEVVLAAPLGAEDPEPALIALRAFLQDTLGRYYRFSVFRYGQAICVIAAIDEDNTKTDLLDLLSELCADCGKLLNLKVCMGIGHSAEQFTEIPEVYKSASEALSYCLDHSLGTAVYINDIIWEQDNSASKAVAAAKKYIQAHYMDPDLSAEEICRFLHVSPNYFSTIFKKETGQTYVAFLTETRLDKAIWLLQNTKDKTYMIAEKIGYQDQNYFSYVFKKRYGTSPTKYRKTLEEKREPEE